MRHVTPAIITVVIAGFIILVAVLAAVSAVLVNEGFMNYVGTSTLAMASWLGVATAGFYVLVVMATILAIAAAAIALSLFAARR